MVETSMVTLIFTTLFVVIGFVGWYPGVSQHSHSGLADGGGSLLPVTMSLANPQYFDPGASSFIFDEFMGGNVNNGAAVDGLGELNWAIVSGSVGSQSILAGGQNHPGQLQLLSGAAATNKMTLELQPSINVNDKWDSTFIFKTGNNVNNQTDLSIGWSDLSASWARLHKSFAQTTWQFSVPSGETDSLVTVLANTYYKIRIRQNGGDSYTFNLSGGGDVVINGALESGPMFPHISVLTNEAVAKSIVIDQFSCAFSGLTR
jgi:hypothetical protein